MKLKRIILFFLILSLMIPNVSAADFGEDDQYLGQVVDNYVNNDSVAATIYTIHNETLECMELDKSAPVPTIENFSTYTEVDNANNRIQLQNDTCVWHNSLRNEETYMYNDYGAKTFFEYDITFEVYVDFEQKYARGIPFMLSNNTGGHKRHIDNGWGYSNVFFYRSGTPPRYFYMSVYNNTYSAIQSKSLYALDQWYYIRVRQNQTHYAVWVYTDEDHTALWFYGEIPFSPEYYSTVYCANGYMTTGGWIMQYFVKDMSLFYSGGYDEGHYYTTEVLDGDRGLNLLYNASIPASTNITLEFSDDNVTWVNHNNVAGYDDLADGFEAVDIRDMNTTALYLRVNMTTTNNLLTPRIYQLRFVTVTAQPTTGDGLFPGLAIGIALLIIGSIYALEKRR